MSITKDESKKLWALIHAIEGIEGVAIPYNIGKPLSLAYLDLKRFIGREDVVP